MRRVLRYFIAFILIPLALLAGLELCLRAVGYGYPRTLFVQRNLDGRDMLVVNEHVARRYLHNPRHRKEFRPLPACIPLHKPTNTYRVFVFGESAAQGMCYEHVSFSRMLDVMLNGRRDGWTYEVVNCGIDAIDSRVIREFVDEVCAYQPDLLILYCGNNELIGPFGPMSVSTRLGASAPWFADARVRLSGLKLAQLAQAAVAALRPGTPEQEWSNTWVRLRQRRQRVLGQADVAPALVAYTNNIRRMVSAAQQCGADLLVCTPVINLRDFPPFASAHNAALRADELAAFSNAYLAGVAAQRANAWQAAAAAFRDALAIDGQHADTHYRLAECLYEAADYPNACQAYLAAAMFDSYAARPGVLLSTALYQLLRQDGIPLCLLDAALGSGLRFGLVNFDRAFDHVHLTADGHYLAASNILVRLVDEDIVPRAGTPPLSQADCLARLGWSAWDATHAKFNVGKFLLRNAMLPHYLAHARVARIADARCGDALRDQSWRSNTTLLADAAARCLRALEQRPRDALLQLRAADAYAALGAHHIAYGHLQRIQALNPWFEDINVRLARTAHAQGLHDYRRRRLPSAVVWFARGLDHRPSAAGYINRAQAYTEMGSNTVALADYAQALALEPRNALAHNSSAVLHLALGQTEDAVTACTAALEAEPDYGPAYANRAAALAQLGRTEDARRDVAAARRLGVPLDANTLRQMGLGQRSPVVNDR
jgi:tetratricopeptide (TPR) repeat protein